MPAPNRHPNAGKPWTPQDDAALRRLAEADTPLRLIADRLGRSQASVSGRAAVLGVVIGKTRIALKVERDAERRGDARGETEDSPPR
jgi:hypothetical protein